MNRDILNKALADIRTISLTKCAKLKIIADIFKELEELEKETNNRINQFVIDFFKYHTGE